MKLINFLVLPLSVVLGGCSAMLPYRDDFQCQKGQNSGMCASVSEVYEMSFDMESLKEQKLDQKAKPKHRSLGGAKKMDKETKRLIDSLIEENKKLGEIAEALEIRRLQNVKREGN